MASENLLKKVAKKYECLSTDGKVLKCDFCDVPINYSSKNGSTALKKHLNGKKHKSNELIKKKTNQPFIHQSFPIAKNDFAAKIAYSFAMANIPFFKLENPHLKELFESMAKIKIPSYMTLVRSIEPIHKTIIENVKAKIQDKDVYLIVDETTDACNRYLLNILIRVLDGEPHKPFLISATFLNETKSENINKAILTALSKIYEGNIPYEKIVLILTDQGSNMMKCIRDFKNTPFFKHVHHVTCLAHTLHRVCEYIRNKYKKVNNLIGLVKSIFVKSPLRRFQFKQTTNLPTPPEPSITRWGTWLEAIKYYIENFTSIQTFIDSLEDKSKTIIETKELMKDSSIKNDSSCLMTH